MSGRVLHIDLESRGVVDLLKVGAHRYAEDPDTEIILARHRFDDGPMRQWAWDEIPDEVIEHILAGGRMCGHNQQFERVMLNETGLVSVNPAQQDCTLSRAVAMGLPASLDALGPALKLSVTKDKEGHRLMLQMCKPRGYDAEGKPIWWEDDARLERLGAYCERDVDTECAADACLPPLSQSERRVWELDQRINDRGVALDLPMVRTAMAVVASLAKRANTEIWKLTNGAVKKTTETAKIVAWITEQGVPCESIAEAEHEGLIVGAEIFDKPVVQKVVELRAASAKALKFPAMQAAVCRDGRLRGSLKYHATVQGRWAGAVVQPHNMKRIETEEDAAAVRLAVDLLHQDLPTEEIVDRLEFHFDQPLDVLSMCARPCLIAEPGQRLIGGDFSNIEGRICAWLAGEEWKLQAFRDYDAGVGPDLYKVTASNIIGIPVDQISKAQRQEQGKVPELACGYQGSVGAFKRMGAKYGVRLDDKRIKEIVEGWRYSNPRIAALWPELQDAAIEAVGAPGCVVSCCDGRIQYTCLKDKSFLFCKLPSGRVISYVSPALGWKTKKIKVDGDEIELNRWTVSYWGQKDGWREIDLYGGMQCAHVVSGTARDVLVGAMFRVEEAGYPLVLTVHDELLSEAPIGFGSLDEYRKLLLKKERWFDGVPISASVWEGPRYDK